MGLYDKKPEPTRATMMRDEPDWLGWQTIDSAPRDGTEVQLTDKEHFCGGPFRWENPSAPRYGGMGVWIMRGDSMQWSEYSPDGEDYIGPTHWKALDN